MLTNTHFMLKRSQRYHLTSSSLALTRNLSVEYPTYFQAFQLLYESINECNLVLLYVLHVLIYCVSAGRSIAGLALLMAIMLIKD